MNQIQILSLLRKVLVVLAVTNILAMSALAQGAWSTEASLPALRSGLSVGVVNGTLYAIGGDHDNTGNNLTTVEAYDSASNSWSTKAPMNQPRDQLAVGVLNGKVYAAGGWQSPLDLNVLEVYDPATNGWTFQAPMPTARRAAAGAVANGKFYVVGGGAAFVGNFQALEEYDPVTNSWTTRAPMPTARGALAFVAVNGILYAIGGHDNNGNPVHTVEAYNPATNTWTTRASMPTARSYFAAAETNGLIYAVGGYDGNSYHLNTVEVYDPAKDTWSSGPPLPTGRYGLAGGSVGDTFYAVGGGNYEPSTGVFTVFSTVEALIPGPVTEPTPFPITPKGNGKLAYTQGLEDGTVQIFTSDPEGGPATQLTSTGMNVDPAYSPDGTRIAFASNRDGNLEIYVMNADGTQPVRLTNAPRVDRGPAWSPDGQKIVFVSRRDTGPLGNFQLYVMNADGSGQTRLTNNTASDGHPSWSPDGMHIAFTSDRDGNGRFHIYLMNPDGTNQTRVHMTPQTTLEEGQPAWSPDGTRLLFVAGDLGAGSPAVVTSKLYSALADGSDTVQLTTLPDAAVDTSPTYSPNGSRIAFVTWADANATVGSVVTMGSTGGPFSSPIHDSLEGHAVSWQPVSDVTAPTSTGEVSGTAGNNGWFKSDVTLMLNANDGSGTGVRRISYSASGAQPSSSTDVSGSSVALSITAEGETTVTYFATDNAGNVEAAQTITIRIDKTAPVINAPSSILAEAASSAGAVVNYSATATDNFDPTPVLNCVPPSGTTFSLGTSSVQCTASDASGNNSNASIIVTVVDTTKPILLLPSDISVDATSPQGATVSFIATATDAVDPHPVVNCSPLSGSTFTMGVHLVQCTATDASGNSAQGSFNVTVNGPAAQTAALITLIQSFNLAQGTSNSLEMKLRNVLDVLNGTNTGKTANACKQLEAFINSVQAQSGKELTTSQADQLIASAIQVRNANGCQ